MTDTWLLDPDYIPSEDDCDLLELHCLAADLRWFSGEFGDQFPHYKVQIGSTLAVVEQAAARIERKQNARTIQD